MVRKVKAAEGSAQPHKQSPLTSGGLVRLPYSVGAQTLCGLRAPQESNLGMPIGHREQAGNAGAMLCATEN